MGTRASFNFPDYTQEFIQTTLPILSNSTRKNCAKTACNNNKKRNSNKKRNNNNNNKKKQRRPKAKSNRSEIRMRFFFLFVQTRSLSLYRCLYKNTEITNPTFAVFWRVAAFVLVWGCVEWPNSLVPAGYRGQEERSEQWESLLLPLLKSLQPVCLAEW